MTTSTVSVSTSSASSASSAFAEGRVVRRSAREKRNLQAHNVCAVGKEVSIQLQGSFVLAKGELELRHGPCVNYRVERDYATKTALLVANQRL